MRYEWRYKHGEPMLIVKAENDLDRMALGYLSSRRARMAGSCYELDFSATTSITLTFPACEEEKGD